MNYYKMKLFGNVAISLLKCATNKTQVHKSLHYISLNISENTNHRHRTDHCNFKFSKNIHFEKNRHSIIFLIFQKICKKIKAERF